jgi:hypothetical protein
MDNVELNNEPEKAQLEIITKRELWRVAQRQYDPLGLLCVFTIRFKLLMRSMVEEASGKVSAGMNPSPLAPTRSSGRWSAIWQHFAL